MLTRDCIMCGGKISLNAIACPHCGDPGYELKERMRREQQAYNAQNGIYPTDPGITKTVIDGAFNSVIGFIVLGTIALGFYMMFCTLR